jgi:hypothetical protein
MGAILALVLITSAVLRRRGEDASDARPVPSTFHGWALWPLAAVLIAVGIAPRTLTTFIEPPVAAIVDIYFAAGSEP